MKISMPRESSGRSQTAMSEEEKQVRKDLAAAYRLVAMFGWDDLLATHISAKVPKEDEAFLVNPFGLMFEEITAASLVKVNLAGDILQETPYAINRAGFVIHGAVHGARHEAGCVLHLHGRDGVAVSATEDGLLPLNQTAMLIRAEIRQHEYEGVAIDEGEKARLVTDLGDGNLMLLRNHGTLAVGASVAEAFLRIYMLEWACSVQVRTLAMGLPLHQPSAAAIEQTTSLYSDDSERRYYAEKLVWPALIRKLDRENPGYSDL